MKPALSWAAIRKGAIYCAPACGGNCTFAEYQKAKAMGKWALSKLRRPQGWKILVHENLGWHVSLSKRGLRLSWNDYGNGLRFSLIWNLTPYNSKSFKDPNQAIAHWLDSTQAYIEKCAEAVAAVRP